MSDSVKDTTATQSDIPNENIEKDTTDVSNGISSGSSEDNTAVPVIAAKNGANNAASGKKRPLEDQPSPSSIHHDATDAPSNEARDQQDQIHGDNNVDDGGGNDNGDDVSNDDTEAPLSKKARMEDASSVTLSEQNPQDLNDQPLEKKRPIFGSTTASAFAAYGITKQQQQQDHNTFTTGILGSGLGDSNNSDHNNQTANSFNHGGGFGVSTAATASATSSVAPSTSASFSVFGKGTSCASLGFGMAGNPSGSFFSSTTTTMTTTTSSAFGGTNSSVFGTAAVAGAAASSCVADNQEHDESSPVPPMASLSHPIVSLPVLKEPVTNGEENEEAILTLRAKLFKLSKVKDVAHSVDVENLAASAGAARDTKMSVGIEMATKVGQQQQQQQQQQRKDVETSVRNGESSQGTVKMDWKEVGIGPLRVLTSSDEHARIVQRRENTPGGQGTKLILNVALRKECKLERKGDKFVRFAAFEVVEDANKSGEQQEEKKENEDHPNHHEENQNDTKGNDTDTRSCKDSVRFELVQYLFKVKTTGEADMLLETLAKFCTKMTASS